MQPKVDFPRKGGVMADGTYSRRSLSALPERRLLVPEARADG